MRMQLIVQREQLEYNPDYGNAYSLLTDVYCEQNQKEFAEELLKEYLKKYPE